MATLKPIIEGNFLHDILDQPAALQHTLEALEEAPALKLAASRLERGDFKQVVLTGMGSSYHALHPLNLQLIAKGYTSLLLETSELIHYMQPLIEPSTLLIVASQSGESIEVVRLLEISQGHCYTIGVTNTPGSVLATRSDVAILTRAGEEAGVSCKTYIATLLGLNWLGDILCDNNLNTTRQKLAGVVPAVSEYLKDWKSKVVELQSTLSGVEHVLLAGRGPSLATTGTGGLIVKESAHFHAEGMSSGSFKHGPLEFSENDVFVVFFEGASQTKTLNQRLAQETANLGTKAALVCRSAQPGVFNLPPVADELLTILEILPVQMIALAVAANKGREAGHFEHHTKVVTVE
jgi:glucosamine--fructose-6-phosphate aminotransferase (isomerizing)